MSGISLFDLNVNFRSASTLDALEAVKATPDVICLQEVTLRRSKDYLERLISMGFVHCFYSGVDDAEDKRYGNFIASRWPLTPHPHSATDLLRWPQLVAHSTIHHPAGAFELINVHVPNASGNGWAKVDTIDFLHELLISLRGTPCILVGDLNEPQYAIQDDRVVTFAEELASGGEWEVGALWKGRALSEWDSSVRWLFEAEGDHGLSLAYWQFAGAGSLEPTHVSRGNPRWMDHAFVSSEFAVRDFRYAHGVREELDLSDHSALLMELDYCSA